jgi:hypothetical protein
MLQLLTPLTGKEFKTVLEGDPANPRLDRGDRDSIPVAAMIAGAAPHSALGSAGRQRDRLQSPSSRE